MQVDMQEAFLRHNLYYERKVNQYGPEIPNDRIVVNEVVAQSYLGIVLKRPSDARRRKYKVWGEQYDKIFGGQVVEPYVIATLLHRAVASWMVASGVTDSENDVRRKLANNGAFHIARVAAFLWRETDNWQVPSEMLNAQIQTLENQAASLHSTFTSALDGLLAVVSGVLQYLADVDLALRSATLDGEIDKALHQKTLAKT